MSSSVLHILNGDASLQKFRSAGVLGQCLVWRETLTLGPLFYQLDSELFWEMRSQFMERAYGAKLAEYRRKVISEFGLLRKFNGSEIVLWYEFDVFCQVNFIALMSYLLRNKKGARISIVCVGDHPDFDHRVGLGHIPSEKYEGLYDNRIELAKEDLLLADRAWMLFCSMDLENFSNIKSEKLLYLEDALEASKVLFKGEKTFSFLEEGIMSMAGKKNLDKKNLIRELLISDKKLGFGDLQYEYMINKLEKKGLITFDS